DRRDLALRVRRAVPLGAEPRLRRRRVAGRGAGPRLRERRGARVGGLPRRRVPCLRRALRGADAPPAVGRGIRGILPRSPTMAAAAPAVAVGMMSGTFGDIRQLGYVVQDLGRGVETWTKQLGV